MAGRGYGEPTGGEWDASDRERERGAHDQGRDWRSSASRGGDYGSRDRDEDRGFFQRAGEEIRSWFSDDDDDRRRERNEEHGQARSGGGWSSGSQWERDRGRGGISDRDRERSYGRIGRGGRDYMNEDRGRSSWPGEESRERERGFGPSRGGGTWEDRSRGMSERSRTGRYGDEHGYGGFQGDYGGGRGQGGFGGRGDWEGGRESSSSERYRGGRGDWEGGGRENFSTERDRGGHAQSMGETNQGRSEGTGYSEFRGTLGGFGNQRFGTSQDDLYRSWRDKQMEQLDRDYEEYCRDCEQRFHQDFDSWRRNRQSQSGQSGAGGTQGAGTGTGTGTMIGNAVTGTTGTSGAGAGGAAGMDTGAGGTSGTAGMGSATTTGAGSATGGTGGSTTGGTAGSTTGGTTGQAETSGTTGGRGGRSRG